MLSSTPAFTNIGTFGFFTYLNVQEWSSSQLNTSLLSGGQYLGKILNIVEEEWFTQNNKQLNILACKDRYYRVKMCTDTFQSRCIKWVSAQTHLCILPDGCTCSQNFQTNITCTYFGSLSSGLCCLSWKYLQWKGLAL